ncbi:MAG: ABC transporter permease [Verrucomicrobia bacterium]|nr:MAG: ABC transporter permease [Verrucomicrobiota bacterium]
MNPTAASPSPPPPRLLRLLRAFGRHEAAVLGLLVVLAAGIGLLNPAFFSWANACNLLKSSVTLGLLALGVLVVLISGHIDISFPAIAACSMYVTCLAARALPGLDHLWLLFPLAAAIGATLGLLNAWLIHRFQLPALIVTLGTAGLIRGGMLAFIGTRILTDLPASLIAFAKAQIFERPAPGGGTVGLSLSFFVLVAAAAGVWLFLNRTVAGRGVYAMGGAPEAARRAGFNLGWLHALIHGLVGLLAGIAGLIHAAHMRNANPFDIVGIELTVIAAVVLGGASITGGRGSVAGTLLGVALLVILNHSLLLVGLASEWQKVFLGLVILLSTGFTARGARRRLPWTAPVYTP